MIITPVQSRMARAALRWSLEDLAREADLGVATAARFETGQTATNRTTLSRVRKTYEAAGLRFLQNGCVCPPPEMHEPEPPPQPKAKAARASKPSRAATTARPRGRKTRGAS